MGIHVVQETHQSSLVVTRQAKRSPSYVQECTNPQQKKYTPLKTPHDFNSIQGKTKENKANSLLRLSYTPQTTLQSLPTLFLADKGIFHKSADRLTAHLLSPRSPARQLANDDVFVP